MHVAKKSPSQSLRMADSRTSVDPQNAHLSRIAPLVLPIAGSFRSVVDAEKTMVDPHFLQTVSTEGDGEKMLSVQPSEQSCEIQLEGDLQHIATPNSKHLALFDSMSPPRKKISRRYSEDFQKILDKVDHPKGLGIPLSPPIVDDIALLRFPHLERVSHPEVQKFRQAHERLTQRNLEATSLGELEYARREVRRYELATRGLKNRSMCMCMTFKYFNPLYYTKCATTLSVIDLHLQTESDALILARVHLQYCRELKVPETEIITGRGLHSKDEMGVLSQVVFEELNRHTDFEIIQQQRWNPGSFTVVPVRVEQDDG